MEVVITILRLRFSWLFELKIPLKITEYSVMDTSVVMYSLFCPTVINTFPCNSNIIFLHRYACSGFGSSQLGLMQKYFNLSKIIP